MEETVLGLLRELEGRAGEPEVKQLAHHARETEGQIRNLQQAFASLGTEPQRLPCPAIEGLRAQGEQLLAESGSGLTDAVILSGCSQVEHHEIAVYSGLITIARQLTTTMSTTPSSSRRSSSPSRSRRSSGGRRRRG